MKVPHIIEVLQAISGIAQWMMLPHPDESREILSRPPFIAWTPKNPSVELDAFFRRSVSTFKGSIDWHFEIIGTRYLLMPKKLADYSESHGGIGYLTSASILKDSDPEFGLSANTELWLLADHLRQCWEIKSGGTG